MQRIPLNSLFALAVSAVLFASNSWATPTIETILYNGAVFTSDSKNPWVSAVAIDGSRFVKVGTDNEVLSSAGPETALIDLQGQTVIPGLNDAHAHIPVPFVLGTIVTPPIIPPDPGPSLPEIAALVETAAMALPPGNLIAGFIADAVFDNENTTRNTLDAIAPNHPVLLFAASGTPLFINTAAMAMFGISETEPDPAGGYFERDPDTGVITGEARGYAAYRVIRALHAYFPDELLAEMYGAVLAALPQFGVTSIQEMPLWMSQAEARNIVANIDLPIRIRLMCHPTSLNQSRSDCMPPVFPGNGLFSSHGIKWHVDGSEYNGLAAVTEPYIEPAGTYGKLNFSEDELLHIVSDAVTWPFAIQQRMYHVIGDRGADALLQAMDAAAPSWLWRFLRTRMEHGDMIRRDQVPALVDNNIVTVMSPLFMAPADVDIYRFGPDRAGEMYPLKSLRNAGVHVAFGTDFIGEPLSPFLNLMFAVTHPVNPKEAVTMEEAVIMHTVESAYAEFQSFQKGKIKPGYLADLAVLSQDIFSIPPMMVPDTFSLLTMVGGRIVFDAGVLSSRMK